MTRTVRKIKRKKLNKKTNVVLAVLFSNEKNYERKEMQRNKIVFIQENNGVAKKMRRNS